MSKKIRYKSIIYSLGLAGIIALSSCSKKVVYSVPAAISTSSISTSSAEKQLAFNFVTAPKNENSDLETKLSSDFVSHDQEWGGNASTFVANRNLDPHFSTMEPIRILQDESLVAVHSRMYGDTLKFRWDIFRVEQQKIQEHWSNVHDSIGLNPDKHSEIDGPTIPQQLELTDTNRALIARFIDQCMIREDGGASQFFNFGLYIQHNREVGDGINGLLWGMLKMKFQGKTIKFKNNYHIIAEGNLVLTATEGYVADEKVVFYDLFRVEENKIVEHWDIISPVHHFLDENK
jgi:predicted SnoaL-like aldol condensation-catalyzing enzyme